jgi:hypothetical protein
MSASQNNLSLIVNQQDSSGVNILNRLIGVIAFAGVAGEYINGILTTTGATVITLPTANVLQFAFHNTHATANITVNWTPTSATGSVIAAKVGPGGVLAMWMPTANSSGAITAVTGTADVANATYEVYMGG